MDLTVWEQSQTYKHKIKRQKNPEDMVMYSTITPKHMMKTIKLSYPIVSILPKDHVAK